MHFSYEIHVLDILLHGHILFQIERKFIAIVFVNSCTTFAGVALYKKHKISYFFVCVGKWHVINCEDWIWLYMELEVEEIPKRLFAKLLIRNLVCVFYTSSSFCRFEHCWLIFFSFLLKKFAVNWTPCSQMLFLNLHSKYEKVWENYSILENIFVHFTQAAEKQIQLQAVSQRLVKNLSRLQHQKWQVCYWKNQFFVSSWAMISKLPTLQYLQENNRIFCWVLRKKIFDWKRVCISVPKTLLPISMHSYRLFLNEHELIGIVFLWKIACHLQVLLCIKNH